MLYIFLLNGSKTSASVGYRPLVCFEKNEEKIKTCKSQILIINIVNIYVAYVTIIFKSTKLQKKSYPG